MTAHSGKVKKIVWMFRVSKHHKPTLYPWHHGHWGKCAEDKSPALGGLTICICVFRKVIFAAEAIKAWNCKTYSIPKSNQHLHLIEAKLKIGDNFLPSFCKIIIIKIFLKAKMNARKIAKRGLSSIKNIIYCFITYLLFCQLIGFHQM